MVQFDYDQAKEHEDGTTFKLTFREDTQHTSPSLDDKIQHTIILAPGQHNVNAAPMETRELEVDYLKTLFDKTADTHSKDAHRIVEELNRAYLPARDGTGKKVLIEYGAIEQAVPVGKSEVNYKEFGYGR